MGSTPRFASGNRFQDLEDLVEGDDSSTDEKSGVEVDDTALVAEDRKEASASVEEEDIEIAPAAAGEDENNSDGSSDYDEEVSADQGPLRLDESSGFIPSRDVDYGQHDFSDWDASHTSDEEYDEGGVEPRPADERYYSDGENDGDNEEPMAEPTTPEDPITVESYPSEPDPTPKTARRWKNERDRGYPRENRPSSAVMALDEDTIVPVTPIRGGLRGVDSKRARRLAGLGKKNRHRSQSPPPRRPSPLNSNVSRTPSPKNDSEAVSSAFSDDSDSDEGRGDGEDNNDDNQIRNGDQNDLTETSDEQLPALPVIVDYAVDTEDLAAAQGVSRSKPGHLGSATSHRAFSPVRDHFDLSAVPEEPDNAVDDQSLFYPSFSVPSELHPQDYNEHWELEKDPDKREDIRNKQVEAYERKYHLQTLKVADLKADNQRYYEEREALLTLTKQQTVNLKTQAKNFEKQDRYISQLQDGNERLDEQNHNLVARVAELELENSAKAKAIEDLQEAYGSLKCRNDDLEKQKEDQDETMRDFEDNLRHLREQLAGPVQGMEDMEKLLRDSDQGIENARQATANAEKRCTQLENEIAAESKRFYDELRNKETENAELQCSHDDWTEKLKQLGARLEEEREAHEAEVVGLQQQISGLQPPSPTESPRSPSSRPDISIDSVLANGPPGPAPLPSPVLPGVPQYWSLASPMSPAPGTPLPSDPLPWQARVAAWRETDTYKKRRELLRTRRQAEEAREAEILDLKRRAHASLWEKPLLELGEEGMSTHQRINFYLGAVNAERSTGALQVPESPSLSG